MHISMTVQWVGGLSQFHLAQFISITMFIKPAPGVKMKLSKLTERTCGKIPYLSILSFSQTAHF